MARIAVLGGSFNPPHIGHLLSAVAVKTMARMDAVWLMPVFKHAFEKHLAPFDARVSMCHTLLDALDVDGVSMGICVSQSESDLPAEQQGRSIHLIRLLMQKYPQHQFHLVVGSDIMGEVSKWLAFEELTRLAPLIVIGRCGFPTPAQVPGVTYWADLSPVLQIPEMSSSAIRERVARGESLFGMTPPAVEDEIKDRRLYLP